MAYYKDLREHIQALDSAGKLVRVKKPINKDTELMPIVRWQFRGLPESERKAFLFENVYDSKGKKYEIPVLVACHAASREIYAIGLMCKPDEINAKMSKGRLYPIEPIMIDNAPCQEVVHIGDKFLEHGGLSEIPVPISTPGFDNGPYLSAANVITKDPDTGIRNVGNYRAMIKSDTRTGLMIQEYKDARAHWKKYRERGLPLPAVISLGPIPVIGDLATIKIPYGVDELAIAGGIVGEPIKLVKCKTVDVEVPAFSEIILEGEIPTDSMERDAPFGEYTGFMGTAGMSLYFNVKCITHRRNPIYNAFISQFPPSESSKIRQIGGESMMLNFLKNQCGLPVIEVAFPETCGTIPFCVVSMKKFHNGQAWQVLNGVVTASPQHKFIIVVDDDIDPHDADSVNWALSWRVQPDRDMRVIHGISMALDFSVAHPSQGRAGYPVPSGASGVLIDATRKWEYPPTSLPKKEFMEKARQIWEDIGLPKLTPKRPWYGESMGYWTEEFEEEARLAVNGDYYQTGEKLAKQRKYLDKSEK